MPPGTVFSNCGFDVVGWRTDAAAAALRACDVIAAAAAALSAPLVGTRCCPAAPTPMPPMRIKCAKKDGCIRAAAGPTPPPAPCDASVAAAAVAVAVAVAVAAPTEPATVFVALLRRAALMAPDVPTGLLVVVAMVVAAVGMVALALLELMAGARVRPASTPARRCCLVGRNSAALTWVMMLDKVEGQGGRGAPWSEP